LDIGGSQTLTAAVFPDDASDKTVYWASSHPNVATVENGKITAVSGGSAIIRVSTKNGNQRGDCVAVVTSAPANVKAAAFLGRQVDLSWNEIKEARSYHIYRSSSAEGTYSKLDNTATASYRDINPLTGNGEYNFYKISAVYDKEREGPKSDYATGAPPNKPTGFKAEKSGTYIYLSWDYAIDAGRYFIYRRNSAEEEYVKTGESGSSPFYDNSPTKGNNYYYKVSAVNPFDESEPSNPDFCEF
jgi:fibronectin type 3 domain-containing protein